MELWLDTIDRDFIISANKLLPIIGITTNPSILSKSELPLEETLHELLSVQQGYLAVQVTADQHKEMIKQAERLIKFSEKIIVKVPVTKEGLSAMSVLAKEGITLMATAIYEPTQILLSALAGARYAAPYIGRINELQGAYLATLADMLTIISTQHYSLKIIAAAIRNKQQLIECSVLGVSAMTLSKETFADLVANHSATENSLNEFKQKWQTMKHPGFLVDRE